MDRPEDLEETMEELFGASPRRPGPLVPIDDDAPHDGAASISPTMTSWTTRGDGIDGLRARTSEVPRPGAGQVLVQVSALSLNYRDLLVIGGHPGWAPAGEVVPVSDAVGVVVARGPGVTRFRAGDRVLGAFLPKWRSGPLTAEVYTSPTGGPTNRGMLAQYVLFEQEEAVLAPAGLSDAAASTLPIAGVTAWHAVARRCRVRPGDRVLIHGTGGVALFALQLVVALGGIAIITSGSDEKLVRARALGAAHTLNHRTSGDVAVAVLELTAGRGADHVIETVGGGNLNVSLRALRIGGTIAFIGLVAGLTAEITTYELVTKNASVQGIETGSIEMLEELVRFVDERGITPVVDSVFEVADIVPALRRLEGGGHFGKVVVAMSDDRRDLART